jgi:3',5'-cyclic AMP phosphodiesterase CpdA
MRHLVHLSDLHFGALRVETLEPLLGLIGSLAPHAVVVSGDLTQRATTDQFRRARAFLEHVPCKRHVIVPGNHDVPLWNLWRRFGNPRRRFDQFITDSRFPTLIDDEVAVVGLDTARSMTMKNGRVNRRQLHEVLRCFRSAPRRALRIVTCHHPFVIPEGSSARERAGRSEKAVAQLVQNEVDLLLTGHRHIPWVSPLGTDLPTVHAGTTTSQRTRGTENSFNDIFVESETVTVRRFVWQPGVGDFNVDERATVQFSRSLDGRIHTRELPAGEALR